MSFIIGKISRKVSKENKEYFLGKVCNLPVRVSWSKKGQDDLYIFLDTEKINFLSEQKKAAGASGVVQEENKQ